MTRSEPPLRERFYQGNWQWIWALAASISRFFRTLLCCRIQRILRRTRCLHRRSFEPDLSPYSLGENESLSRRIERRRSPYLDLIRAAHEQPALPQGGLSPLGRAENSAQWRAKRFLRAEPCQEQPQRSSLYSHSPGGGQVAQRRF